MDTVRFAYKIDRIDTERREVHGTLAQEIVDSDGDIFDYSLSKPHFIKWSADIEKKSKGKSKGNIRAMHGSIAAGKLISIGYDDENKKITGVAKITDDGEWEKCKEGVYVGFSLSGRYVGKKRFKDEDGQTRYEVAPFEVSIVDNPAIPTALFDAIKAEGAMSEKTGGFVKKDISAGELYTFAEAISNIRYLMDSLRSVLPDDGSAWAAQLQDIDDYILSVLSQLSKPEGQADPAPEPEKAAQTEPVPTPEPVADKMAKADVADISVLAEKVQKLCADFEILKQKKTAELEASLAGLQELIEKNSEGVDAIVRRIEKIEKTPLGGGPRLNLEGGRFGQEQDELSVISRMIESEQDPHVKQALGLRYTKMSIRKNNGGTR